LRQTVAIDALPLHSIAHASKGSRWSVCVVDQNKALNGGETICVGYGVTTIPATQSKKGVRPESNETRIDHLDPKSKGGAGSPHNGQLLCFDCNGDKSDQDDWVRPKNRKPE